jgi:hypothetical protein
MSGIDMANPRSLLGFVLFRDPAPPRAEAFAPLTAAGFRVSATRDAAGAEWALDLDHDRWGRARIGVMRGRGEAPPAAIFEADADLLPQDLAALRHARSAVLVEQQDNGDRHLADRKRLLGVLGAATRCGALAAVDMWAQKAWSLDALDEELSHAADVDVSALYKVHAVTGGGGGEVWLHTHGLAELGLVDFDVLRAAQPLLGADDAAIRALAWAIVEGRLQAGSPPFTLASPEGDIQLVPVADFTAQASPEDLALRGDPADESHNVDRGVVCEPRLEELAPYLPAVPAGLLAREPSPHQIILFSKDASRRMAERARATLPSALRAREAHPELDLALLVKVGLDTSSGSLEHVWVRAGRVGSQLLEGELVVEPNDVPGVRRGSRGDWPRDRISGWCLMTPLGHATPHAMGTLRRLRADPEEARRRAARGRAARTS